MKFKVSGYVSKETKNKIKALISGDYGITPIKTESQLVEYALEKLLQEYLEDYKKQKNEMVYSYQAAKGIFKHSNISFV